MSSNDVHEEMMTSLLTRSRMHEKVFLVALFENVPRTASVRIIAQNLAIVVIIEERGGI